MKKVMELTDNEIKMIKLSREGKTEEPDIQKFQIEIRGRVIPDDDKITKNYEPVMRFEIIASSYAESVDLMRDYLNGTADSEVVKCTMKLA